MIIIIKKMIFLKLLNYFKKINSKTLKYFDLCDNECFILTRLRRK